MWTDEEMVDLVNEAYETTLRAFRLVHAKWGLTTMNTATATFVREGESYAPGTELRVTSTQQKILLPPDFAELVRVTCTNNRSVRVMPAQSETYHWIDVEKEGTDDFGASLSDAPSGLTFYYDIIDSRTLFITPPVTGTFNLEIDYIPMKRPLYYSNAGTVTLTNESTTLSGSGTLWVDDNIFSAATGQSAELIVGTSDPKSNLVRVDKDYPIVSAITSNTAAALNRPYGGTSVSGTPAILSMVPALPREYHRWISRLASSLMLSKINPELAERYAQRFEGQFAETIQPTIKRRQSQDSRVVEDAEEFGMGAGSF